MRSGSVKPSTKYCPAYWSNSLSKPTLPLCCQLASSLSVLHRHSGSQALASTVHREFPRSTAGMQLQRWVLGLNGGRHNSGHLEKAPSALLRVPGFLWSSASCLEVATSTKWGYTGAEPSCRQGNGHHTICRCVPAILPQILFTNRLPGTFCPWIEYLTGHIQTVNTRGTEEMPGFLQHLAVLHFLISQWHEGLRVCPAPLGAPVQHLLKAALPNAGLLSGHLCKKRHVSN